MRLILGDARAEPGAARQAPAPDPPKRDLPTIAEKADDLEAIKKAVDNAAAVGGGLWLSYLFVLFYLAVAAGAVTHEDLFFEKPVKLPFLGVELPLVAFFALAPLIFLVVHAYTLVHLVMLTDKAKRFHQALHEQIGDDSAPEAERARRAAVRDGLQRQLPSNIFVQFLAGPRSVRRTAFGVALRAIAWITLVIAPILLLLMMQIQFLPFHSSFVTWTQRIALAVDLALLTWLWRKVLSGHELGGPFRASWAWPVLGVALSLAVLLFSVWVVTFPGEWQEEHLSEWRFAPVSHVLDGGNDKPSEAQTKSPTGWPASLYNWAALSGNWVLTQKTSLHDWLFAAGPDPVTRRRFPFSSTLVLPGVNVYEGLGIDDPEKAKWRDFVFRARGRDLKGAIFDLASLPKVDFESADLQGASLFRTQLQGASLNFAELRGALLEEAQLQGAALYHAQLQGAALDFTRFQGASLEAARLQGAWLDRAQLQGTSLRDAQLQGASLEYAGLQGASFTGATLEATDLLGAYLWRTTRQQPPSSLTVAIRLDHVNWLPEWIDIDKGKLHPWDAVVYQALRATVDAVPPGSFHDEALRRIEILDCSNFDKTTLASCETQVPPLPEAEAWRLALEAASVDKKAYAEALAKVLHRIVCSRGYNWYDPIDTTDNKIYTLRGPGFQIRLGDAGPAAFGLIDDLMNKDNKDCPVAAALTDADRAKLLEMKQSIEAKTPGGQGEAK